MYGQDGREGAMRASTPFPHSPEGRMINLLLNDGYKEG